jgi:(p)ppGpp synthase/HD superfamily hydrolase
MRYSRVVEFVKTEYRKNVDIIGDSFIDELTGVADILDEFGYSCEYRITALLRNVFRDTAVRPDEILNFGSMEVLEAIQLLDKKLDCDMYVYLDKIKRNMLALPVKLAEHLYNLRKAVGKSNGEIERLVKESQKFYTKCAKGTKFYEPMLKALMKLKK